MSIRVRIIWEPDPALVFTRSGSFGKRVIEQAHSQVGDYLNTDGLEAIKRYMPKGGTGAVEDSVEVTDESTQHRIRFAIGSNNPQYSKILRWLEYGTIAHTIYPVNALALRFRPAIMRFFLGATGGGRRPGIAQIIGDYVFTKYVDHPGTPAFRMFRLGMVDLRTEITEILRRIFSTEIRWD